jgi:hypothetical protein
MQTLTLTEANKIEFAGAEAGPRSFDMIAYTGAAVDTPRGRAVVDLAGLEVNTQKKPALHEHDRKRIVGFSESIQNTGTELRVKGNVSQRTAAAKEVIELADEGFPWQASIGFGIKAVEQIGDGKSVNVNGRDFAGPITVLRKTVLKENSFVPLGADGATSAAVFSDDGSAPVVIPTEELPMNLTIEQVAEFAAENIEAVAELPTIKAELGKQHDAGFDAGKDYAKKRLEALMGLKGASVEFAVEQFVAGHDTDKAVALLAARQADELETLRAENAKLKSEGGQPALNLASPEPVDLNDPEAAAKAEWTADPSLRSKFSSEKNYINIRKAELSGQHRTLARA